MRENRSFTFASIDSFWCPDPVDTSVTTQTGLCLLKQKEEFGPKNWKKPKESIEKDKSGFGDRENRTLQNPNRCVCACE